MPKAITQCLNNFSLETGWNLNRSKIYKIRYAWSWMKILMFRYEYVSYQLINVITTFETFFSSSMAISMPQPYAPTHCQNNLSPREIDNLLLETSIKRSKVNTIKYVIRMFFFGRNPFDIWVISVPIFFLSGWPAKVSLGLFGVSRGLFSVFRDCTPSALP